MAQPTMTRRGLQGQRPTTKAYLVGCGIASLAAAAYLIKDGGLLGKNITIFEEGDTRGGALDGHGSAETGYVIRGGRMFTYEAYTCLFDLLSFIPSLRAPDKSLSDEVHAFNEEVQGNSKARLIRERKKLDASSMGLSNRDRLELIELMAAPEAMLGARRIQEHFNPAFFKTNFWYMWATTFAFQPWHSAVECKRYLHRFMQEFPRFATLGGVRRTRLNQYDSIVLPVTRWLEGQGVQFFMSSQVTDLDFKHTQNGKCVESIHYLRNGASTKLEVETGDLVFVTNGSMTAASSLGSMSTAASLGSKEVGGSWALWETLAKKHVDFGRPSTFDSNIDESKWLSFTVTQRDPTFFELMEAFTGNKPGTGGLVTFTDSNWLMSVVLAHQPHFPNQPKDVLVFWGYGLFPDEKGNYVKKKMSECTGRDILTELVGQLGFEQHQSVILETSNCIPCMMPFITSQFMPRTMGDRPQVRPVGTSGFAFIGQFCEIPDDVVFTVEYSVRSAQTAVYALLGLDREVTPLYKGQYDPRVVFDALRTMLH